MRIAMIQTPLIASTGGERQMLRLAIELQKKGHEVEIFTHAVDYNKCFPELLKKITINKIPPPVPKFPSHYHKILCMVNIGKKIQNEFDLINNHNFPTEWAAFIAKKRLDIPVVWMCNEPPFWFFHPELRRGISKLQWPLFEIIDKMAVKSIDEIVVLSHMAEKLVRKSYSRPSTIVRSGVDIEPFQKMSGKNFRKEKDLEGNFILLQVGTLSYYRRAQDSIMALSCLSKKYDNLKLLLLGKGSNEALKNLCRRLGVEDKVLFFGSIQDEELPEIYAACDVFIFPALLTWGIAVTEAMAAGKPVIVSKKSGASEIIEDNVNGFVIDHAKPMEIAVRIERLINDPELKKKIGINAHNFIKYNLSWANYAKDMEKIFEITLEKKFKCLK